MGLGGMAMAMIGADVVRRPRTRSAPHSALVRSRRRAQGPRGRRPATRQMGQHCSPPRPACPPTHHLLRWRSKKHAAAGVALADGGCGGAAAAAQVLTDVVEVLPLLRKNFEANLSPGVVRGEPRHKGAGSGRARRLQAAPAPAPGRACMARGAACRLLPCCVAACRGAWLPSSHTHAHPHPAGNGASWSSCLGKVQVAELDWMKAEQVAALKPPFDYGGRAAAPGRGSPGGPALLQGHRRRSSRVRPAAGACWADQAGTTSLTSPPPPPARARSAGGGLHLPRDHHRAPAADHPGRDARQVRSAAAGCAPGRRRAPLRVPRTRSPRCCTPPPVRPRRARAAPALACRLAAPPPDPGAACCAPPAAAAAGRWCSSPTRCAR
jgi:hypothetical protein